MTRDQSLSITVFLGESRGSASTTDLSDGALQRTLKPLLKLLRLQHQILLLCWHPEIKLFNPFQILSSTTNGI